MYAEDETELRDLVMQNLEKCGFISKIKAELRAGVFIALEEEGNLRSKIPLFNKKLDDFTDTTEGKLIMSIVREFLEYFNLECTLSVFDPEVACAKPHQPRADLCKQFKVEESAEEPVLVTLLKNVISNRTMNEKQNEDASPSALKTKPESNDSVAPESQSAESSTKDIFTKLEEKSSKIVDHDSFFDDPLPNEKPAFFMLSDETDNKTKNIVSANENKDLSHDKGSLSSLKDLPSLTKSTGWSFSKGHTSSLSTLDNNKSSTSISMLNNDNDTHSNKVSSDTNEDSSDKQINSEESIEEEIEEDFSAGVDDLLNSLSIGDDATTDQSVSQVSTVEGVDHIELCNALN